MKWPPTDLKILEEIYCRHYGQFAAFSEESPNRSTKIYVPIDIDALANHFGIDGDILFGRLYYYLDPKYGYEDADGTKVLFFSLNLEKDRHVVHFPLLASVLAELRAERKKHLLATWLSIAAIVIAVISASITLMSSWNSWNASPQVNGSPKESIAGRGADGRIEK